MPRGHPARGKAARRMMQLNPEGRPLRLMSFDPHGVAAVEGRYDEDDKVLWTTNGKAWRPVGLGLKGKIVAAAVVDVGCFIVLLEDGRTGRYLDPG
jgi:hypothetical protein